MKKTNLITLLLFGCLWLSCTPKTEKAQPIPEPQYYNSTHNYKLDDDELQKRKESLIKAQPQKAKLKKSSTKTN